MFEDRPVSSFQRLAAASNADVIVSATRKPYAKLVDHVWFVNAGSVGKPKDGNWQACYVVLDLGAPQPTSFVRVPYDIRAVTQSIRQSDLPDEFAVDLERGGFPLNVPDIPRP